MAKRSGLSSCVSSIPSTDATQAVFCAPERKQVLRARSEHVRVGVPICSTDRPMRADIFVAVHDERGLGHCTEVWTVGRHESPAHTREIPGAFPSASEDDAGPDARLGLVPGRPVARICVAGPEEQRGGPRAQRVPSDGCARP
jgi:hypothetical protein